MLNFLPSTSQKILESIIIQYKRLANVYFLFVAILVSIPAVSPLNPALIWLGVFSVLIVSVIKEGTQGITQAIRTIRGIRSTRKSIMTRRPKFIETKL